MFQSKREQNTHRSFRNSAQDALLSCSLAALLLTPFHARGEVGDPLDPFSRRAPSSLVDQNDENKTPEDFLVDAAILMQEERLLDARTKLLKAIERDPTFYRAHLMLAGYYIVHVGHFRLALKYVKQAEKLFEAQSGLAPYLRESDQSVHANILYLLAQTRLNLDNYEGALAALDLFEKQGYFADWYPATRAWVLMKLGRLEEAITTARVGLLSPAESGRTLNMLGILLSMHGEPDAALKVFQDAIQYELALGAGGQPATPLNNSGEVYKEMFLEDRAEGAWSRAKNLPDGCEHVLPSLNLSLLYIDHLALKSAAESISSFLQCFSQYTLRNGEEHQALVHLARGRIALHSGHLVQAIDFLEQALDEVQWFGKIGTNELDLRSGAMVSLAQALEFRNNQLRLTSGITSLAWVTSLRERALNSVRIWWLRRRSLQVLIEDLKNFEDLRIRNTDSLLEYPTLGTLLTSLPASTFARRIGQEDDRDKRQESDIYYRAYKAENTLARGNEQGGKKQLDALLSEARLRPEKLLYVHLLARKLQHSGVDSDDYLSGITTLYQLDAPAVLNYGLKLPVKYTSLAMDKDEDIESLLVNGPFIITSDSNWPLEVKASHANGKIVVGLVSAQSTFAPLQVRGSTLEEVSSKLVTALFTSSTGVERLSDSPRGPMP